MKSGGVRLIPLSVFVVCVFWVCVCMRLFVRVRVVRVCDNSCVCSLCRCRWIVEN